MTRLIWTDPAPPTEGVSFYDHCFAESPLGQYRIEWKSWKKYDNFCTYGPVDFTDGAPSTLDEAKASAEAHLGGVIAALVPVTDGAVNRALAALWKAQGLGFNQHNQMQAALKAALNP